MVGWVGWLPAVQALTSPFTNALSFNGVNQHVTVPAGIWFSNQFTVEAWVYPRAVGSWPRLLEFGNGPGNNNIAFALSQGVTGQPVFQMYTAAGTSLGSITSSNVLPQNAWSHLAYVFNGSNGAIFMNGVPVAGGAMTAPTQILRTNNYVARSQYVSDTYPNAIIDEVRLWNVARTPAQVAANLGQPLLGNENGLILYYRFDSTNGTVATNSALATGNAANGTLVNGPAWVSSDAPANVVLNTSDTGSYSLRNVIASATAGSTITFDPGLSGKTIRLTSGPLILNRSLTIDASALPGGLSIDGNAASSVFNVTSGTNLLAGLNLTNGMAATGYGGAISNSANLTLRQCSVAGNGAFNGGGIFSAANSSLVLNQTTISGNSSTTGGGIWSLGNLALTNCTLAANLAGNAGGLYSQGPLQLAQTTVSGNLATNGSGGVFLAGGSATLLNTLIAGNQGTSDPEIGGGGTTLVLAGHNLIGQPGTSFSGTQLAGLPNANGHYVGTTASPLNPNLAPLGNYGGPTLTMPPFPGSLAIDTATGSPFTMDQRGFPRPSGVGVDIGSAEANWTITASFVVVTNQGTITILRYAGAGTTVIIPDTLNGLPVTSLASSAFANSAITGVTLPASLTNIAAGAFQNCFNLSALYANGNAPFADPTAFANDSNATLYYLFGTTGWGPTLAGVPTVSASNPGFFNYQNNAGAITILQLLGGSPNIIIPHAINGLPVVGLANNACAGIFFGNLFLPGSITNFGTSVFQGCSALTNVVVGSGLTALGAQAFQGCTNLRRVVLPASLTSIGFGAFNSCSSLTSIMLPASLNNLGDYALSSAPNLSAIYFQGNVPLQIGASTFLNDPSAVIYYSPGAGGWSNSYAGLPARINPFNYSTNGGSLILTGYTGPIGPVTIPPAFFGLPVTSIGANAFTGSGAVDVVIPASVTSLASNAFANSAITSVTLPPGITNLATGTFQNCFNLSAIYANGNAPFADPTAFAYDSNATLYYLFGTTGWGPTLGGVPTVSASNPGFFNYQNNAGAITILQLLGGPPSVIIPHAINGLPVVGLANNALANTFINNLFLPGSITNFGTSVFQGCSSITNVVVCSGLTTLGVQAFTGCANLRRVVLPTSLTSIGFGAFNSCSSLTSIMLPAGLNNLGDYALSSAPNLSAIYFQGNVPLQIGASTFLNDPSAVIYYSPGAGGWSNSLAGLPVRINPFNYTTNGGSLILTGYTGPIGPVSIPPAFFGLPVTSIGANAFTGSGAVDVVLPASVTSLSSSAFANSAITSVTLPPGVTNLAAGTFQNCFNLSVIYANGNAPTADPTAFGNDSNATLYYLFGTTGWSSTLSGVPTVSASNPGFFNYQNNAGAITILQLIGGTPSVIIPHAINGLPVVGLANNALANIFINNLFIPGSITNFGTSVFQGCSALTNVVVGGGLTTLGAQAFQGCANLRRIVLPGSLTSIGVGAFFNCNSLTSIMLPSRLNNLGDYAFASNPNLTTLYWQGDVPLQIGASTFLNDPSAVSYYSPGTSGWSNSFAGLPAKINPFNYTTNGGSLILTGYTGPIGPVSIPPAFFGLPVTSIGANAFTGSGAMDVVIPASVTSLASLAFQGAANLTSVTLPPGVTNLAAGTFQNCFNLSVIYANGNAPTTDPTAFANDGNATLYYLFGTTGWSSNLAGVPTVSASNPSFFNYQNNAGAITILQLIGGTPSVIIPHAINGLPVVGLANNALANLSINNLILPGSITNFGTSAFQNCSSLTNVVLGGGLTTVGVQAFLGCANLRRVSLPASLTAIGVGAFFNCNSLTSIMLPARLNNLGDYAFASNPNLAALYWQGNVPLQVGASTFLSDPSAVSYYSPSASGWSNSFAGLPARINPFNYTTNGGSLILTGYTGPVGPVTIPPAFFGLPVTSIGSNAFTGSGATDVVLPASVTSLAGLAFQGCSNLTSITLPPGVTNLAAGTFRNCSNLSVIYANGNAPTADPTAFGNDSNATLYYLFGTTGWSASLAGVPTVSASNPGFFNYQNNAGAITILQLIGGNPNVIIPDAINGLPVVGLANNALANTFINHLFIPGSITNFGVSAFQYCTSLTNVVVGSGVTIIGPQAFLGCSSLTSVTLPASVTTLGTAAFAGCSSLTKLTLPASIQSIGDFEFSNCYSLVAVLFLGNPPPQVGQNMFFNAGNAAIYYTSVAQGWTTPFAGVTAGILTSLVTTANDSGFGSLRNAIQLLPHNSTITFAANLAGATIRLTSGTLTLNSSLNLDASGLPGGIILDGNASGSVFYVTGGSNVLTGLTITNGNGLNGVGGGGIYNTANLTLNQCTIAGNGTSFAGGGIDNEAGGQLTLRGCLFQGNRAYEGGAVRSHGATLIAENCTVTGNLANIGGGCSAADGGPQADFTHCTFTGNAAASEGYGGGGLFFYNQVATFRNCLIAGNSAPTGPDLNDAFAAGQITSLGGNLIGNTADFSTALLATDHSGHPGAILDPQLAPLASYGGTTPTRPPLPGSPALDSGVPTTLTTDQRGFARVSGPAPDCGAVECAFHPTGAARITRQTIPPAATYYTLTLPNSPGQAFMVQTTTDLTLPQSEWILLGTAVENPPGSGQYQFTSPLPTSSPVGFFSTIAP